ncbi:MAG: hypothetical protein ACRDYU_04695 [Actinomycetes bacterium]
MARQSDTTPDARERTWSGRGRTGVRAEPVRSPQHVHLSLAEVREYRQELRDEESRVSYWRRILQARLDLLTRTGTDRPDVQRFGEVLGGAEQASARTALIETVPVDDVPPLPDVARLWHTEVDPADTKAFRATVDGLVVAEQQLSTYRDAVINRLNSATAELIARYHEDPALCLKVLPLDPEGDTPEPSVR